MAALAPYLRRRMRVGPAAIYCGFENSKGLPIVSSFLAWLKKTDGPEGLLDAGNRYWYVDELDRHLDLRRGVASCCREEGDEDLFLKASRRARGEDEPSVSH